jgi:hypothetical protein
LGGGKDWPFGTNIHSLQTLVSKLHLKDGWTRFEGYDNLVRAFWETSSNEVGGLDDEHIRDIKAARVLGLLRSLGFTSRLANQPEPVPIKDDERGRYAHDDTRRVPIEPKRPI